MSATWQSQLMMQTASRLTPKTSSAPTIRSDMNSIRSGKSSWHRVLIQTYTTRIILSCSTCRTGILRTSLRASHMCTGIIWIQTRHSTMQTSFCPLKLRISTTITIFDKQTFNRIKKIQIHILEFSVWRCCKGRKSRIPYGLGQASLTSLQTMEHSSWLSTKSCSSWSTTMKSLSRTNHWWSSFMASYHRWAMTAIMKMMKMEVGLLSKLASRIERISGSDTGLSCSLHVSEAAVAAWALAAKEDLCGGGREFTA